MKRCRSLISRLSCGTILVFAVGAILFYSAGARADEQQGKITHDLTVGSANDVQLKTGQVVQVLKNSGEKVVIMVQLPDGSNGIYQIDASAIEIVAPSPAPPPSAPPPPSEPPPPAATTSPDTSTPPAPTAPAAPDSDSDDSQNSPTPPSDTPAPVASDPHLPEDRVTQVHVSWPSTSKLASPYEDFDEVQGGSYSYRLYLPPGYYEHPNFHYPALFIDSPSGNANMGEFAQRARKEEWIVVMTVESKNGPDGPCLGDMMATHADIVSKGLRIQDGLKFATGFSGGARMVSLWVQICPGFNGLLMESAGFAQSSRDGSYHVRAIPHDQPFAVFMTMGTQDSNHGEVSKTENLLGGVRFKSETFNGGHEGAPYPLFEEGMDWLVEQALSGALSKDTMTDDLRESAGRLFSTMAGRLSKDPDKAGKLAELGDRLNFPDDSPGALALKNLKNGPGENAPNDSE